MKTKGNIHMNWKERRVDNLRRTWSVGLGVGAASVALEEGSEVEDPVGERGGEVKWNNIR